jgi:hypothetical protein
MARKTITVLTDDLTGKELEQGTGQTVSFSLDGTSYELDLSKKSADKLRADLKLYTDAARRVTGSSRRVGRTASAGGNGPDPKAVRAWAKENGVAVSERGRIPADVIEKYRSAR